MAKRAKRPTTRSVSCGSLGRTAHTYRRDLQWPLAEDETWRCLQGDRRLRQVARSLRCRLGPGSFLQRRLLESRLLREYRLSKFRQFEKAPARDPIQMLSLTLQNHRSLLGLE